MGGRRAVAALAAAAAAGLVYANSETRRYTVRRAEVPVLPPGQEPLRLLHISDLHLTPRQRSKVEWVQSLRELRPDLVVVTGDFLSHDDAVATAVEAFDPFFDLPGIFVLGSNDYYAPRLVNPATYLRGPSELDRGRRMLPWPELVSGLTSAGWVHLPNARARIEAAGRVLDVRGVDDPHILRDDYAQAAGPAEADADLSLGVTHAPYLRVLDAMDRDGLGLIVAGHTHGGQLRIPWIGALVTNCDLDRARARGLSRHGGAWLNVSAGMGQSPFAPFRCACPPEASLLTLVAGR